MQAFRGKPRRNRPERQRGGWARQNTLPIRRAEQTLRKYIWKRNRFSRFDHNSLPIGPVQIFPEPDIYSGSVRLESNPLKLLNIQKVSPLAPRKNYFLNLSRTGGVSVNCFRLPSQRGPAHHSRSINPVHKLLAQEIKFLLEHNRETPLQIPPHPNIKTPVSQGLSKAEKLLFFNILKLLIESLNQLPKLLSFGFFFRPGLVFQLH